VIYVADQQQESQPGKFDGICRGKRLVDSSLALGFPLVGHAYERVNMVAQLYLLPAKKRKRGWQYNQPRYYYR
jgi:hypothetical protein